ncbi:hypothetical protein ZIOFF_014593 [Zingiber officinale]|uniref:ADP-ribosylation factor-like protein 8A n=1 Tax=Zingiber officinale TaxID=94328 RepID=A0A8J5HWK7_ZINOF|nr:hypothetical protein ZIOFF_014593 [Zingiber officinale]
MGLWEAFLNWLRSLFFKQEMELSLIGLQNAGKTSLVNVIATGGYSEDMIPTVGFNMRKVTKGNVTIKLWDLGGQPRFRSMWERYCRAVSAIVYDFVFIGKQTINTISFLTVQDDPLGPFFRKNGEEEKGMEEREGTREQSFRPIRFFSQDSMAVLVSDISGLFCVIKEYVVDAADRDNLSISKGELHDLLSKPSLTGIPLLVLGNKIDKPEALTKQSLTDAMGLKSITDREVCCYMISCKNSTNIDSVIEWLVKHSRSKN